MPLQDLDFLQSQLNQHQCQPKLILSLVKESKQRLFNAFDEGISVCILIKQYALYIDTILNHCFHHFLNEQQAKQCSLVAVGGYGRLELLPNSDVDLMVLLNGEPDSELESALSAFLTTLWDFGLEIGHSVRTIEDCIIQGKDDITIITNMIESRLITGSQSLYSDFQKSISTDHLWSSKDFFEGKLKEQKARHAKFNNTAYNLEPDIKEGPGGLRDIQIIGWVAKRHFKADTLEDLVEHKFLTEEEYQTLASGQEMLWKVRFALQRLTNRREDRLLFDYQNQLSRLFGYESGPNNLSIEQFMQSYYRTIMQLERLSEMLLQLFKEEILFAEDHDPGHPINERFLVRNGFIEVAHKDIFKQTPSALIEIFVLLQQHAEITGVHASTIRLIREHISLIDDNYRNNPTNSALFIQFIRNPTGITHQLRRMNTYGVLAAYIPAFEMIVGRMQYDLYHAYTVDTHTLFVIRNMRRFSVAEHKQEFPLCSDLHAQLEKPELLYLAGLFHDIAKGRGGDHAELGARDALQFCLQHQLSREDAKTVSNLVKLHLSMSMTAQKQDLSDPEVILEFAELIGNSQLLDYLYLLTVSDIRATNPAQWNSWKDSLLKELYHKTKDILDHPDKQIKSLEKLAEENKERICDNLQDYKSNKNTVEALCQSFPDSYYAQYRQNEIEWHIKGILSCTDDTTLLIHQSENYKTTEVFIHTKSDKYVMFRTTTAFDNLGLNVFDARILLTKDHYTLDTFLISEANGDPITSTERLQQIRETLRLYLEKETKVERSLNNRIARQLKSFGIETELEFTQDYPNQHTILEITTNDRPGILSVLTQILEQNKIYISSAKITTLGEKVNDIFTITNDQHQLITDETILNSIKEKITTGISELH